MLRVISAMEAVLMLIVISPFLMYDFHFIPAAHKGRRDCYGCQESWKQKGARFALDALLLLTLPLLLTYTKFVVLPALAEDVHQLLRLVNTKVAEYNL